MSGTFQAINKAGVNAANFSDSCLADLRWDRYRLGIWVMIPV